ncbi:MAG: hypothetical protein JRJ80_04470 [Deltaproteobacteria bacterium]|nr:hypothetical protein [Deltaproteobacteria bacterium]MBW1906181.1 hypothetical protein [Deltaproteobacteria bacterium]MBW2159209.1 hypothetical protein [Deltaproteobacteria bacterium]MBW2379799.1 hypothetical protein [Deltaproteobacteria bacterium]MBW2687472.1 hypothetical protein [Deltaproteobacteria bacterium]
MSVLSEPPLPLAGSGMTCSTRELTEVASSSLWLARIASNLTVVGV